MVGIVIGKEESLNKVIKELCLLFFLHFLKKKKKP